MKNATKRIVLRWVHLIATIPVLGYIYGKPSDVVQYVGAARFIFVPVLIVTGYCLYGGIELAAVGVALWLGAVHYSSFGVALLGQIVLLVGRAIWRASQPWQRIYHSSPRATPQRRD